MRQAPVYDWYSSLVGHLGMVVCGKIEMKGLYENYRSDIDNKSSIPDMLVFTFDFGPQIILLGYPRYAEYTELLHRRC